MSPTKNVDGTYALTEEQVIALSKFKVYYEANLNYWDKLKELYDGDNERLDK